MPADITPGELDRAVAFVRRYPMSRYSKHVRPGLVAYLDASKEDPSRSPEERQKYDDLRAELAHQE